MRVSLLAGLLLPLCACQAPQGTEPARDDRALEPLAGRWLQRGPRNIIGAAVDTIADIAPGAQGWTIQLVRVHYPSVSQKGALPQVRRAPVARLECVDGRLVFTGAEGPWTFAVENGALVAPAWIRRDDRSWEYAHGGEEFVLRCEHDPRLVPDGSATTSKASWPGSSFRYHAGREPSMSGSDQTDFAVHVHELPPGRAEFESFVLVQNAQWARTCANPRAARRSPTNAGSGSTTPSGPRSRPSSARARLSSS
jgi:hypothetical protein